MVGMSPSSQPGQRRDNEYAKAQRVWIGYPQGHGLTSGIAKDDSEYESTYVQHPIVDEYFRHCFYERKRRLGEKARILSLVGTIFPNTSYHGRQPRGLCVWHPHGTDHVEGWRFFLVDADAPAEVKDVLRRYYMRYSGPAGMTEQDDMENWLYATRASSGTIARRHPFNYQMSMGARNATDLGPGLVATQMTDQTPRNFYRAYTRYLRGGDWDSLLGRDVQPIREAAE
jgi:hypothetical protein